MLGGDLRRRGRSSRCRRRSPRPCGRTRRIPSSAWSTTFADRLFLVQAGDDDGDLGRGRHARSVADRSTLTSRSVPSDGGTLPPCRRSEPARRLVARSRAVRGRVGGPCRRSSSSRSRLRAVSIALPLGPGRDLAHYLVVYAQLFEGTSCSRSRCSPGRRSRRSSPARCSTPGPSSPSRRGVPVRPLGRRVVLGGAAVRAAAAVVTAAALLLYPGYVLLFHRLSSDVLFAAGFALVAPAARRAPRASADGARRGARGGRRAARPRPPGRAGLPAARPRAAPRRAGGAERLQGRRRSRRRRRAARSRWSVHNGVRFDDLRVARGGGATLPLFRAFVADRIVEPDNGPASRELARGLRATCCRTSPTARTASTSTSSSVGQRRMHEDLIGLADRTWGWDDDYRHLARVGREAVLAHPGAVRARRGRDVRLLLLASLPSRT